MKKLMSFVIVFICVLNLCSCSWASKKAAVIGEDVTKINITYCIGSSTTSWSVEGVDIDLLRDWYNNLDYQYRYFRAGQTPGNSDGGIIYEFVLIGEEQTSFCYVICGEKACYLLSGGNWFPVSNPTDPPISVPTK